MGQPFHAVRPASLELTHQACWELSSQTLDQRASSGARRRLANSHSMGSKRNGLDSRSCCFVKSRSSDCPEHLPSTSSLLGSSATITRGDRRLMMPVRLWTSPPARARASSKPQPRRTLELIDITCRLSANTIEYEHTVERLNLAHARLFSKRAQSVRGLASRKTPQLSLLAGTPEAPALRADPLRIEHVQQVPRGPIGEDRVPARRQLLPVREPGEPVPVRPLTEIRFQPIRANGLAFHESQTPGHTKATAICVGRPVPQPKPRRQERMIFIDTAGCIDVQPACIDGGQT